MANEFEFPWVKMIGAKPSVMERGRLVLTQTPTEMHINHNGDANASLLYCLAEMCASGVLVGALGAAARDAFIVIRKGCIEYEARARGELTTEASLTEERLKRIEDLVAKREAVEETVSVTITNSEGKVVARGEVTVALRPRR